MAMDMTERTLGLLIEYDGTDYAGWQTQPNAVTVQETIERALEQAFGTRCSLIGSGRTDAGVHARGQVAHTLVIGGHAIPTEKIRPALNTRLPRDIRIRDTVDVPADFHARYQPLWREYVYTVALEESVFLRRFVWHPELPYDPMLFAQAAAIFEGSHDFTTFSKHNPDTVSYLCDVSTCRVEPHADRLVVRLRADRFVYGMVRSIVGAMFDVARGKRTMGDIADALRNMDRSRGCPLAPPTGLVLNRLKYTNGLFDHHISY